MKLKILAVIVVVLATTGFLLFTEQGKKYAITLGDMTRGLANLAGNFVGSFIKISNKEEFIFDLESNKEAIYGQSFSFSNASFKSSCRILNLIIDGRAWEASEKVKIEMEGRGEISIGKDGKLILKADTNLIKLDSWKTKNVKVEMEVLPENFSLDNAGARLVNITSASGTVNKQMDDIKVKVDFSQADIKLEGFYGSIEFGEKLRLAGIATNIEVKGNKI
ncbi:MAG: hypothetical protein QW423_00770 [Candidatus Aenigmatarchaeota archaeon]